MSLKLSVLDQSAAAQGRGQDATIRQTLALAEQAEAWGYHRFWVSEHHSHPSIVGTAPEVLMAAIAARWSITLGHPVTPAQVVLCMIDLKLARLGHDPKYRDGPLDVIGYAALLHEVTK